MRGIGPEISCGGDGRRPSVAAAARVAQWVTSSAISTCCLWKQLSAHTEPWWPGSRSPQGGAGEERRLANDKRHLGWEEKVTGVAWPPLFHCVRTPSPPVCVCVWHYACLVQTIMKHPIASSFKHTQLGRFHSRQVPLKSPHYHFLLTSTLSDAQLIAPEFLRFLINISLKKNNASHKVTRWVFDAAPINAVLNY